MRISGRHHLAVPRQQVWDALRDPAVLARATPGCRSIEATAGGEAAAVVDAEVGSLRGTFQGTIRVIDQEAPASCRLAASGAGVSGTVDADAAIRLDEVEGGTEVHYEVDAMVGGAIGGVGQRMLAGVATRTASDFFTSLEREVGGAAAHPVPVSAAPAAGGPPASEVEVVRASAGRGVERLVAAIAGVALAAVGVLVGRRLGARSKRV